MKANLPTASEKFAEALLDVIMSAEEDEQKNLRAAYDHLIGSYPRRGNVAPLIRNTLDACKEAFELIDEAEQECKPQECRPKESWHYIDVGSKVRLADWISHADADHIGTVVAIVDRHEVLVKWYDGGQTVRCLRSRLQVMK